MLQSRNPKLAVAIFGFYHVQAINHRCVTDTHPAAGMGPE